MNKLKKLGLVGLFLTVPLITKAQSEKKEIIDFSKIENIVKDVIDFNLPLPILFKTSGIKYDIKVTKNVLLSTEWQYNKTIYKLNNYKKKGNYISVKLKLKL